MFDPFLAGVDLFDGKSLTIDSCARSNSVDSLRTTGHSRSVSHDSYFDLLQSPLRGGVVTCPSRELSELGLNFDREEPEMRIFSESESLVSSPKVAKEVSFSVDTLGTIYLYYFLLISIVHSAYTAGPPRRVHQWRQQCKS